MCNKRQLLGLIISSLILAPKVIAETEHHVNAKASLIASYTDSFAAAEHYQLSRLEGDDAFDVAATLQASYEFGDENWGVFSHWQATTEGQSIHGKVGMVELYGYYTVPMDQQQSVTFTLGQFFMPTSLENSEPFWDSPYSNNYSALNTWIAQEIRPIGLELRYDNVPEQGVAYGFGVMGFGGNDSMGSMLAWKGWSIGRHKSVYGEVLSLPQLDELDDGTFSRQRDDGTKPFGQELDQQIGTIIHGYWSPHTNLTFRFAYLDSQGDGRLHRQEYAWANYFNVVGVRWQISSQWILLMEQMEGRTAMGWPKNKGVAADFLTNYILLSYNRQQWDYTIRLEQFNAKDRAKSPTESNDKGKALTLSVRWQAFGKPWSVIGEWLYIDVDGRRTRALDKTVFTDEDESQLSVSLNYFF